MMEEPLSRGASPSGGSSLSGGVEIGASPGAGMEDRLLDVAARHSLSLLRTPPAKKAKRVRFFRNGDKFYTGVVMAVTPERYRSFDSLATDLTRALISSVTLPNGVRSIYTMDGRKVASVGDLEDGKCYVCSGQGETFKRVEYSASKVRRGSSLSGLPQSPAGSGRPSTCVPPYVQAKIVTLIRHGTKPRRVSRLLLNKRNAPSLEHALEAITEAVKLDSGAVRKVYTLGGTQVTALEQFFDNDEIFLAYGTDKSSQDDFELDFEESKAVQSFRRGPCLSKRYGGPMPTMPKKSGKKTAAVPQVRTPSPVFVQLPLPLRMHFVAGHVIGDGNFAVVRHCVQRRTGLEYALKIIDKYKCQGQGTMLDSEIAIMRQVCHPNVISLIAEQETTDQLFLVMELVKGGDLFDAIAAATKFSEAEASVMISHLTSALAYLHAHHIVHRDVKPENLLVEMEGSRVTCLKLGDFGLAQIVREPLYTVCGTPTYVAPEILAETGYGLKIDVWAAGVIMYILLCGFPPFVSPENEQEELFERILSGHYEYTAPYWDCVSESAKQLVSNMLQVQPELRFSAEDVLDHPWLASFLGGEQAASTASEPAQQYWDKQRKPIRQATFDFNYDYKSGKQFAGNNSYNNAPLSSSDTRINQIDFPNGYCASDEPQSLDISCLEDIRAVTKSLHDLMDDLGDGESIERSSSVQNSVSSLHGRSELQNLGDRNGNLGSKTASEISTRNGRSGGPKTGGRASSVRNGNSLSDVRARATAMPKLTRQSERRGGSATSINAIRKKDKLDAFRASRFGSSDGSAVSDYGARRSGGKTAGRDGGRKTGTQRVNSSNFSSSDNDIETSDSFVNIQFANFAESCSSESSRSVESTDSFENVQWARFTRPADHGDEKKESQSAAARDNSRSKAQSNSGVSKPDKKVEILTKKVEKSSGVKMREKKPASQVSNSTDELSVAKNEAIRSKRYSCHTPQSGRRAQFDATPKKGEILNNKTASAQKTKKFNSTDELSDPKQKLSYKAKRYSLYYTPQPSRKSYGVIEAPKNEKKKIQGENAQEFGRNVNPAYAPGQRKETNKSRKSVAQTTTAASRNRANKQSIHIKPNVA